MDKALNVPPRLFEPESIEAWSLPTWLPWESDHDILDAVYDTYLWCVPRPRKHLKRPKELNLSNALYELCVKTGMKHLLEYPCPKSAVTVRDVSVAIMPSLVVLENLPRAHMVAYTCLLMTEFTKASKIPPDVLDSDTFLDSAAQLFELKASWDEVLRSIIAAVQTLPKTPDADNQYVTYDYWLKNLNVSDEDTQELSELIREHHMRTRLSEASLLARARIGILRNTHLSVYFV